MWFNIEYMFFYKEVKTNRKQYCQGSCYALHNLKSKTFSNLRNQIY